ncbi:putative RNA-directed DNA polymerase from transposon X-element [Trichonephila clavipes]|uniref:Putative RNA-directed DNA polymerase from transposon X-element n=1 Tax=Trichonephila clavipes TaxID=2585209 RepID=A0A8X6RAA6_TRICX|nr:putative RNA-directed DNA polymerase from transposon X-element [Trichonephila clavipes]
MHKNKEKDKNAYFKIPNPTHGGQPTNSQTCSESFPKFIVLHATDNRKLFNASPFLISKAVQGSAGSVKSIKKLPSGDLLIETATQAQSINLLQCTNLSSIPITATPHKTLNSSKGVIYCPDLIPLPDSEIEKELASQGVEAVKRITSIKDDVFAVKVTVMEQLLVAALLPAINAVVRNTAAKHVRQNGESVNMLLIPKWQQEKEIQRIKVLENISYSEAKKRVVNILPPRASTYANAVITNTKSKKDTATQTDPITNNLIDQETILSPPETSSTDLESLNQDKRSPETSHLSVPSDAEALMEIDKSSIKRPATDIVQEAAKILKPSIRIESGGIQTTKEVEDVKLLSKKGKSRQSFSPIKYDSEKPKGSP